jgi:hypothetical protein
MAAIGRKMGLDMRNLNRGSHEAKRMPTCSMDKFFWNIGTEESNRRPILGKLGRDFFISQRGDGFDLF